MAIAVVGDTVGTLAGGANTATVLRNSVLSGSLLVVNSAVYNGSGSGTTCTVSDNVNAGNYSQAFALAASDNTKNQGFQHYKPGVASGNTTVTVDPVGTSADIHFTITEISGADTSAPLDASPTAEGALTSGAGTTGTVTTGALHRINSVAVGLLIHSDGTRTLTPNASYTQIAEQENGASEQQFNGQRKVVSGTGAVTADWTIGSVVSAAAKWDCGVGIYMELPNVAFAASARVPNNQVGPPVLRRLWHGPGFAPATVAASTGNRRRRVICTKS